MGADSCLEIPAPRPPGGCPIPTWEQCAEPMTACDRYFRALARKDAKSECALLFEQKGLSEATRLDKVPVLTTPLYKLGSNFRINPSQKIVDARKYPGRRSSLEVTGLSGFALGSTLRDAALLPKDSQAARDRLTFRLAQRGLWESNGNAVKSCSEYVHERFYDYTVFEDQIVRVGLENHRALFERAYSTATPTPVSAIGTRHLDGSSLKGRDGRPFDAAIPFDPQLPKNQFFTTPAPTTSRVTFIKGDVDAVSYIPVSNQVRITLAHLDRRALAFVGVEFEDTTLGPTLAQGRTYYQESFAWHRDMAQRNAIVLDEELAVWEQRQDDFLELLELRRKTEEEMALLFESDSAPPVVGGGPLVRWWADPVWNPDPTKVASSATQTFDVRDSSLGGINLGAHPFNQTPSYVTYASQTQNPGVAPAEPKATVPLKSAQVVAACTGNRIICLAYRLAFIDEQIEKELAQARTAGCLDVSNGSGPRLCDWSPRRFSQRVVGLFQNEREKVHQRCIGYLSDFSDIESRSLVFTNTDTGRTVNYPAEDYTVSGTKLEQYFTRYDEYIDVLAEAVGPLMDKSNGKVRLRKESGDSHQIGNDFFGASLDYNFGFEADDVINPNECQVQQAMYGRVLAEGRAIGERVTLLDAEVDVSSTKAIARLDVLGNELINENEDLPNSAITVVRGGELESTTFAHAGVTVLIGFIPVTFEGYVAGSVGFMYQLDAGRLTSGSGTSCKLSRAGVSGQLQPLLLVQATASAAVDAVVASAGIKGYLKLITVSLPLSGSASVGPAQDDATKLDFIAEVGAHLQFEFFSGGIAVFLEIGVCPLCESIEEPLFTWDGLRYRIPLFETRARCRLADLSAVAEAVGVSP